MVKFLILKVDQPNCFLGQDLYLFDKINSVCLQLRNSNSKILPCSEITIQKIYIANLYSEIVRIRVLSSINTNTFRCLLIDHGRIEEIRKQNIYNIPLNQLDMDPAIKMIKIPGIIPAGMTDILKGHHISVKLSESDKWMPASYKFVSRIFEEHQVVHVEYQKQLSRDKSYAEVFVIYNHQKENLRDLLIAQGYAFVQKDPEVPPEERSAGNHHVIESLPTSLSVDITGDTHQNGGSNRSIEHSKVIDLSDLESVAATTDSMENESISSIIGNMTLEEKPLEISFPNSMNEPATLYSLTEIDRNRSVGGGLDELSMQILRLKVKCWFVNRSVKETESGKEETHFDYLDTIRPITSYKNEPIFAKFLKDAMASYDTKLLLLIQAYMIPTVLRGVNMVALAPPRKGKSMGLLMPVLQTVATKKPLPTRSYNPLVIILCSSWKRVKDLANAAERFVRFIPDSGKIHKPRIVAAYAGSMKKMTMIPILQGCDILIITPRCLLSWLRNHEFFKLNELEMFCLDDAENIIAEHLDVLREILIFKRTGAIDRGSEPGQFITATHWTSGLESYVKHEMGDMVSIAVNDPLELAVIGRMRHNIIEYDDLQGDLYEKLVGYLELTESSIKRTIIFASDDSEIANVYKYLMQKAQVDLKLMTGSMSTDELILMVKEWNQYRGYVNMPILLISDEALRTSDISIFNADIILHADINESSFGNRLNFLRDKYARLTFLESKMVRRPPGEEAHSQLCCSFIFLCRKTINLLTANFLYKFLGRCNSMRPGWLQEKAVDFILNKEKSKGYNEICPRIKGVGECKLPGCVKRHMVMTDVDMPLLPNRGHIQFRLLHLESPSHFFVRISEIKTDADHKYKSQFLTLKMKMANYFGNPQNICGVNLRLVQVGLIAVVKTRDILERVMVMKMKSNKTGNVLVKLIDKGSEMVVEQADLLHLPRELSEIPAQAVEVYVTGIRPLDNDEYYSEDSCTFAKEFLEDNDLHAVIKLCIGSTLWIDAVTQRVHHTCTNITVFDMNLSVTLLEKNLVDKNSQHVEKLVRLCTGKIDIWKQEPQNLISKSVPIMRKFSYLNNELLEFEKLPLLDDDSYLMTECVLANVVSPSCIFVNNRETIQSARDLQNQIASLIDSIENLSVKDTKIGARVIFHENDAWQRGYIVRIDRNGILSIFALDWGTISTVNPKSCSPLKRLPCEYQELPCQAILCCLAYCLHTCSSYSPDVVTAIKHYATARSGTGKRTSLSVRAYEEETITGSMFWADNSGVDHEFNQLDLFQSIKRYLVTISNPSLEKADEMLHYVLVRNLDVLPSLGFLHEVLPECHPFASRLVRNGSIPHLSADLMSTKDIEKRTKVIQAIERIIDKKKELFTSSNVVSSNITSIIHSLSILIHFVNERPVFSCIYRALNSLLGLAYEKKLAIDKSPESFSVRFIAGILLDYDSIVFHMLRHLEISARSGHVEECRVLLDNFRILLLEPATVQVMLDNQYWTQVMAICIGALRADQTAYNLLMDLLVQLVMLCRTGKAGLDELLNQCCLAFQQAGLDVVVCNSSLSLIICLVNMPSYAQVFRNIGFFEIVLDRFVDLHQKEAGRWSEMLDSALDVLIDLWRNSGALQRQRLASSRTLSSLLEPISRQHLGNSRLSGFVTELILEESSFTRTPDGIPIIPVTAPVHCTAPDADALEWAEKREISSKRQRKSYRRVFGSAGDSDSSSDERHNSLGSDDDSSSSDSSDFEATPFLHKSINPADEDNVNCFEKA